MLDRHPAWRRQPHYPAPRAEAYGQGVALGSSGLWDARPKRQRRSCVPAGRSTALAIAPGPQAH